MYKQNLKTYWIGFFAILITLLFFGALPGYAQTPETTPQPTAISVTPVANVTAISPTQNEAGTADVTFAQFNQSNFELRPPIAQASFDINVPYRWDISQGANYLELIYSLQQERNNGSLLTEVETVNPVLEVYVNDILITSILPENGLNQTLRIPITAEAINATTNNNHKIQFVYFSGDCTFEENESPLVIYNDSFIHFDYTVLPLEINLADFPRPLIQELFVPEPLLIIIPDEYSDTDLSVAASVAATFGQRAFGDVILDIITASEATPEKLAETSAVIIGQPADNAFLLDLYQRNRLPTTLTSDNTLIATGQANPSISADDGVLQEVVSDFSKDHAYLIVTGTSDAALVRAAQTLSVLEPRYGLDGDLVIVSDFQKLISGFDPTDTFTLADFGFNDTVFYGLDKHTASVDFLIPYSWELEDVPSLNLSYVHSNVVRPGGSGLTVLLNNKPVGSVPIDKTVLGERQATIEIPKDDFKKGVKNRLTFEATIDMELPECQLPEVDLAWFRINETSQLYLPHTEAEEKDVTVSLSDPFLTFTTRQDLSDVWFSLPENPTMEELTGMLRAASWIGLYSGGPGFIPQVSREVISDTSQLSPYHIIAFGTPTRNSSIASANEQLPQPFVPGEDNLRQEVGNVTYRLPDDFDIGLLQILPSPWNSKKAMLVVSGTSTETAVLAIDTITSEEKYYDLWEGDIAFIKDEYLELFDSTDFIRGSLPTGIEAVSDQGEVVTLDVVITPTPTASTTSAGTEVETTVEPAQIPDQYLPEDNSSPTIVTQLVFGLIGLGLFIVAIGLVVSWRKNRTKKRSTNI